MSTQGTGHHTILITGAAGFVGVPLIRRFRRDGYRVVAVDSGCASTLGRLGEFADDPEVVTRILDIRHGAELERLFATEPPWAVVHLAAKHFIPECEQTPAATLDVNVLGTQRLLDACATTPPQRLVFASTADVYAPSVRPHDEGDAVGPRGVYGVSKLLGEWLLRDQAHRLPGCAITVARIFNMYGAGDPHAHLVPEILRQVAESPVLRLGDLDSARDFVHVEDVADALQALTKVGQPGIVNVGTGKAAQGRDVVGLIADALGRPLEVRTDERRLRRDLRPVSCAAPGRLTALLPSWPRTTLQEGIDRLVAVALPDSPESRAS